MLWIVLGLAVVVFVLFRIWQIRDQKQRVAEHMRFINFVNATFRTFDEITPDTWRTSRPFFFQDRDHALRVLEKLITQGGGFATPARQQVYQHAFLTWLSSLRDLWSGYPYEGVDGQKELDVREAEATRCGKFFTSIGAATYPKTPAWRQMVWQELLFGPDKSKML